MNALDELLADTQDSRLMHTGESGDVDAAILEVAKLRELNRELAEALEGIFAQTAKHSRQWGQAESALQFARDPDTAKAFANARAALSKAGAK